MDKKVIKKDDSLPEVRCTKCNRLLFVGKVEYVEIKCPRCHSLQKISKDDIKKLENNNNK